MRNACIGTFMAGVLLAGFSTVVLAQTDTDELVKATQNPVANLISVPFQNNTNFEVGPRDGTQNLLNIQPVIPFSLNDDWYLITRTIIPILTQPGLVPGQDPVTGLSDIQFNAFVSPKAVSEWVWGAGVVTQLPTHTSERIGNDRVGLGPAAVLFHMKKGSPWVYGVLINNVWSITSGDDRKFNQMLVQPVVNYNLPGGLYITSTPMMTADLRAATSQRWTIPVGGGVGKLFHIGKQPVNGQISAYYNAIRPDYAPSWQLRVQLQFLFPQ